MNEIQKSCICKLLSLAYSNGFNLFPLAPIAKELGIEVEALYNEDTESGELWEYGAYGNGFMSFSHDGKAGGVNIDYRELLANWAGFKG